MDFHHFVRLPFPLFLIAAAIPLDHGVAGDDDLMGKLFGHAQNSLKQFHFYYDDHGTFTVNGGGMSKAQAEHDLPLHAFLPFRRATCVDGKQEMVRIKYCASTEPKCAKMSSPDASLLLCYENQLGPMLDSAYQFPSVNGNTLTERCPHKKAVDDDGSAKMEKEREKEEAKEQSLIGDGWWNALEVKVDYGQNTVELAYSMVDKIYKFALPEDKCFELKMAQNGLEEYPHVQIVDGRGQPVDIEGDLGGMKDGKMPEEVDRKIIESAQSGGATYFAEIAGGNRGLWLLPWDFVPKTKMLDKAFQTLVKVPESVKVDEEKDKCEITAKIMGDSVEGCILETREFHPLNVVEERGGGWKLRTYDISYGQIVGNEAEEAEKYCKPRQIGDSKKVDPEKCERLQGHLAKINNAIYGTSGFVANFHRIQFAPKFMLMAKTEQKQQPFTRLGRDDADEPDGNVIHQFHTKCAGLQFGLPIHN